MSNKIVILESKAKFVRSDGKLEKVAYVPDGTTGPRIRLYFDDFPSRQTRSIIKASQNGGFTWYDGSKSKDGVGYWTGRDSSASRRLLKDHFGWDISNLPPLAKDADPIVVKVKGADASNISADLAANHELSQRVGKLMSRGVALDEAYAKAKASLIREAKNSE